MNKIVPLLSMTAWTHGHGSRPQAGFPLWYCSARPSLQLLSFPSCFGGFCLQFFSLPENKTLRVNHCNNMQQFSMSQVQVDLCLICSEDVIPPLNRFYMFMIRSNLVFLFLICHFDKCVKVALTHMTTDMNDNIFVCVISMFCLSVA